MNRITRLTPLLGALALFACNPPPPTGNDVVTGDAADVASPMDVPTDAAPEAAPPDGPEPDGANLVPLLISGTEPWLSEIDPMIRQGYSFVAPYIRNQSFAASTCEVQEGCVLPGNRRLLRFTLATPNRGNQDMFLGPPTRAGRDPTMFEYSACHNHYHLRGYADYRLLDMAGREVARGHKQSFCIEDSTADPNAPIDPATGMRRNADLASGDSYNCNNQGLHAGWLDAYGAHLACQWIDITDVPAGRYRIRVTLNADRVVPETNYNDNVAELEVDIPASTTPPGPPMTPLDTCAMGETGTDRECGWSTEPDPRQCMPGTMVTIGCNSACTPAQGICEGDTVIRVCPSSRVCAAGSAGCAPSLPYCSHTEAIATNDNACGNNCSQVTFMCPANGYYRVLTGANHSGEAYTCRLPFVTMP